MTNDRIYSPEAYHAHEDAVIRNQFYSETCICGHQRRQHGKVKCFAPSKPACNCRGGFHKPEEKIEAALYYREIDF